MRMFVSAVAATGALAAVALGQAGTAAAVQDQAYDQQINGVAFGPLARCMGEDVHRLPGPTTLPGHSDTPHLDVACPSNQL